jgi:hypothetical protein
MVASSQLAASWIIHEQGAPQVQRAGALLPKAG